MSKSDTVAFEYAKENGTLGLDYDQIYDAVKHGYSQAEKDVAESFARIIRSNLSMMDNILYDKFEQLYTDITGEKMYKGFID